jgi:CheY-like chemotaxis protein
LGPPPASAAAADWGRLERVRDIIDRQTRHMAHLLDDLLDVSRITRGKFDLRRERLDLVALLAHAAEDFREELARAGLTLTLELPPAALWTEGDPTRLAQVVGNLLSNAAKFTPAGGTVGVRCWALGVGCPTSDPNPNAQPPTPHTAVIIVSDTGVGIDPEMLPRIFETFTQADRSLDRSRGGLGLGLALVKGIVEMHGGRVQVESPGPEQGTTFTIHLPLLAPGDLSFPTAVPPPAASAERTGKRVPAGRILLIEDNLDTAETLRDLLVLAGYSVEIARSGPEGIACAQRFQPERVVCDIGLPGMDGYQVARILRQEPATADAHLIALSGYAREEDLQQSREAGFNSHLKKPVAFDELVRVLQRADSPDRRLVGSGSDPLSN